MYAYLTYYFVNLWFVAIWVKKYDSLDGMKLSSKLKMPFNIREDDIF